MPDYRAYTVGSDGHYRSSEVIVADNDETATSIALKLVDGCGVELWLFDRKVAILPTKNSDL